MEAISDDALVIIPSDGGALAATIPEDKALKFFTTPGAERIILDAARREVDAFVGDASTKKGREAIKKFAMDIVRAKTYIESVGKAVAADVKDIPKKVDASRKLIRDSLEAMVEEVRHPVVEWEENEASRVDRHKAAIAHFDHAGRETGDCSSTVLLAALANVKQTIVDACFEEFEAEAAAAKQGAIERLTTAIYAAEKREAEAAELARLREAEAARKAEEARQAEEKARQEREARIAEEARRKAEADAKRREEALQAEKEAAERRAREAEERAERERKEAARREQEAAERAKRDAEYAEKQRQAREAEEARRREANKAHRARVNNAAVAALVAGGLSESAAKAAVMLIAAQKVPGVSIAY
jgi:colicin import membrane protein